jgi:hydroxymethylpyrimidine/phosphomethylpyrimidine kinase
MNHPRPTVALTVAGSDSSGGAGIQADLKTFAAFGVYGASVLTALTAQNTRGVLAIVELEPAFVAAQFDAVADDLPIAAAKTGMLARAEIIDVVAERLRARSIANLVVDPVMVAAGGDVLLRPDAVELMGRVMLPLAAVVTPNLREASLLLGRPVESAAAMRDAARELVAIGARAALVTGGELAGDALDVLYDGRSFHELRAPRVSVGRVHGAGCTLSAAITACLARGESLLDAVAKAKRYVTEALANAPALGSGARPLNHSVRAPAKE